MLRNKSCRANVAIQVGASRQQQSGRWLAWHDLTCNYASIRANVAMQVGESRQQQSGWWLAWHDLTCNYASIRANVAMQVGESRQQQSGRWLAWQDLTCNYSSIGESQYPKMGECRQEQCKASHHKHLQITVMIAVTVDDTKSYETNRCKATVTKDSMLKQNESL